MSGTQEISTIIATIERFQSGSLLRSSQEVSRISGSTENSAASREKIAALSEQQTQRAHPMIVQVQSVTRAKHKELWHDDNQGDHE